METASKECVHGDWEDGVCECHVGYATYFDETALSQQYCTSDAKEVAERRVSYEPGHYLHLLAMTLTVLVAVAACVVFITAVAAMIDKVRTKRKIREWRHRLIAFEAARLKRDGAEETRATVWTPSKNFQCINQQKTDVKERVKAKAVAAYKPENETELELKPGMIITDVVFAENGWCKGRAKGKTGFFPATFVEMLKK